MLIDIHDVEALASLRAYAEKDVYDKEDMLAIKNGFGTTPGDEPEFVRFILGNNCRVVFTHEWQPIGTCRHVSISFYKDNTIDIKASITNILLHLGFNDKAHIHMYTEKDSIFNAIQLL